MGEDLIGILATKLPKMGEKEKRKKNYDNQVAEILREEREIFNRNFGMPKKKKILWHRKLEESITFCS